MSFRRARARLRRAAKMTGGKKRPAFERLEDRRLLAITIDTFDTLQAVQDPPGTGMTSSSVMAAEAIGGRRDMFVELTSVTGNLSLASNLFGMPLLEFEKGDSSTGTLRVTWDGGSSFPIDGQDETSYDSSPASEGSFVGGDGVGATAYAVAEVITLSDGSMVTVNAVNVNGDVTAFTIDSTNSSGATAGDTLTQSASTGTGTDFQLTVQDDNVEFNRLDPDGLGGIDLTEGGMNYRFTLRAGADLDGASVAMTVYTGAMGGTSSSASVFIPNTGGPLGPTISLPFTDFAGADFQSVGAIVLEITGPEATDGQLDDLIATGDWGSIHGLKFKDVNADGQYDPDLDQPLEGVEFTVERTDGMGFEPRVAFSDANGEFWFADDPDTPEEEGLPPGTYRLTETVPEGFLPSTPTIVEDIQVEANLEWVAIDGQADPQKTEQILDANGDGIPDLLFGNYEPGSIHALKFKDVDANGVYDPAVDQRL
ncbi:MAG: hypothetical protein GTO62_15030, partial [Planctomycetales bacterium]|nr:hypothetical protein [Planctomycetales bacterium]NIP70556.1 hypothetical protein [Planctomycetales bacterium]